jgi:Histidine kinase
MSNKANNNLKDKHLRLWGLPLAVTAWTFLQMPMMYPGRWDLFWKNSLSNVIFTLVLWEIVRAIILRQRQRFPGVENTRQRILQIAFWVFVVNMPLQAAQLWANERLGLALQPLFNLKTWATNLGFSMVFLLAIAPIYEVIYFFTEYKTMYLKTESLKKQQAQQRLNALKTRVNPHFLFNSLTTLSALIGEDAPKAERFVDELSKVYRYLLRAARQPTATLGEELQFAESYSFLLKNRFEEGAFSLSVDKLGGNSKLPPNLAELDQILPTLTLQNALDYLVRTQNLPLNIEVKLLEKQLQIACEHQPKTIAFDVPDNDWRQLEANGARQETGADQLKIHIPFTQNTQAI